MAAAPREETAKGNQPDLNDPIQLDKLVRFVRILQEWEKSDQHIEATDAHEENDDGEDDNSKARRLIRESLVEGPGT